MDPGAFLGLYCIDRELGAGGMGKVYAATGPEGRVALKVVHPHLLETPGFFKRFIREAQLGQSIRDEHVVRTLDCDQDFSGGNATCFLVMEYVEGQTLAELLGELERVPEELCRHVAREICKGLAAIHDAGVVHRDLKPDNVLITPDHVVKIMDLGVAKLSDEAMKLSRSGAFVGSVEYAAPEQFKGGDVDGRTDLHALGVLLYELATGKHPYRGGSFHEVLGRVCDEDPRRLGELNPQLSAYFEEVVHTLLVKDPRGRFASATQLLDVLRDGEESAWWHERARSLQAATKRPIRRIRIPRETAVYGREAELTKLTSLFEQARAGNGQVVLIEGEAGIGKSRLVDELVGRLGADGEDVSFLFGSYPPGGAATAAGGFSSAYREHFGESGSADYLAQTPLLVPAFDAVLRGEPSPTGAVELTKDSLGTCFVHATRGLAEERPTIVLIDDLHFAPEEARTLFTALAQAVQENRVLLIGTMRPGVAEDWIANLTRLDQVSRLEVPRLGPKDLGLLLTDSFNSDQLAHSLGMQIAMKSDGNPFFVFEILRGLREGQFITQREDGTWVGTRVIEEIQIPASVLDLVNARVADLTQAERDLLDVASCCGFEFDPALVADVVGEPLLPTLKQFAAIEKRHRLVRASGRRLIFDHHQVQEALYGSLYEQMREAYHAAIADALEARAKAADADPATLDGSLCVELCDHFLKGTCGERALRYLGSAQTHLEKGYLQAQVESLTERALAVPELLTGTARARALLRLASAMDQMGRRTREEECAREAERLAEEAGDDSLRGEAASVLGRVLIRTFRLTDAEAAFRRSLELAVAAGDRSGEAGATVNLGFVFYSQHRLSDARDHYERGLALSRESGHRRYEANATVNLALVFNSLGRVREAQENNERAAAIFREIGDAEGEIRATANLGLILWRAGRLREAREHFERCLANSREIGNRGLESHAIGDLGIVAEVEGRLQEAREHLERRLALSREIGDRTGECQGLGSLGIVFRSQGRLREAREHTEQGLALCRAIGHRFGEAFALLNLGSVLWEDAESAAAEKRFLESLELSEEIGERHAIVGARLALGSLRAVGSLGPAGDGARARDSLVAARDLAAEIGKPGVETLARCELACLADGDVTAAVTAFTEHEDRLDAAERRGARLLLFRATGDRTHLERAKRLLDEFLAANPPEHHETMCRNVRVNREILAAWREELGEDDDAAGDGSTTESPTRAG
jgi:tetratricopeptide (TPR) repeat protein